MTRLMTTAAVLFALFVTTSVQAQSTTTRDAAGREVYTTTRSRDSTVVRDRLGREVLTTKRN